MASSQVQIGDETESIEGVRIIQPDTPPIFSNVSWNQTLADEDYIRQDGTSTTTAEVPFLYGLSVVNPIKLDDTGFGNNDWKISLNPSNRWGIREVAGFGNVFDLEGSFALTQESVAGFVKNSASGLLSGGHSLNINGLNGTLGTINITGNLSVEGTVGNLTDRYEWWELNSTGTSVTIGSDNQIPYSNATGTGFDYNSEFTFDGEKLDVRGAYSEDTTTVIGNRFEGTILDDSPTPLTGETANFFSKLIDLSQTNTAAREIIGFDVITTAPSALDDLTEKRYTGLRIQPPGISTTGGRSNPLQVIGQLIKFPLSVYQDSGTHTLSGIDIQGSPATNLGSTSTYRSIWVESTNAISHAAGTTINYGLAIDVISDNYFMGKLGIGTTSPSDELNVVGNANITGNLTVEGSKLNLVKGSTSTGAIFNLGVDQLNNKSGNYINAIAHIQPTTGASNLLNFQGNVYGGTGAGADTVFFGTMFDKSSSSLDGSRTTGGMNFRVAGSSTNIDSGITKIYTVGILRGSWAKMFGTSSTQTFTNLELQSPAPGGTAFEQTAGTYTYNGLHFSPAAANFINNGATATSKIINIEDNTGIIPFAGITDRWSIYNAHAAKNYFKGSLGIGTDNATEKLNVVGNANITGNVTSENVFIPQYIYSHTNESIAMDLVNVWKNITFGQSDTDIKYGINHTFNVIKNNTFNISESGVYEIDFAFDVEDTSPSASNIDVAGRAAYTNGTELMGSVFESDITKQAVEVEIAHDFIVRLIDGDEIMFQFVASDIDVNISTHGTFGDFPTSASIVINKIANI